MNTIKEETPASPINPLDKIEEQEYHLIVRRLSIKFNITSESLSKQSISQLIKLISTELDSEDSDEIANKIYTSLLKPKSSSIPLSDFITEIITRNRIQEPKCDSLTKYYEAIMNSLLTKSEGIIYHLQKIQNRKWIKQSKDFNNYIDWIIQTVAGGNLYDLDTDIAGKLLRDQSPQSRLSIKQLPGEKIHKFITHNSNNGIGFLAQYSNLESSAQREKDFQAFRHFSNKYISSLNYSSIHSNNTLSSSRKRRSTNLTSIASPSIIARLNSQMTKIDQIDFDIFDLDDIVGKKTSIYIASEILSKFEIVENELVPPDILRNFLETIIEHYDRVHALYHNDLHAGDVMQTVFTFFIKGNLQEKMQLGQLDTFAIVVAALCHDYKHTGQNNIFHINSKSKIAMRYNDVSVLENYHIAQTFKVLSHSHCNIYKNFSPEEFRICRRRMIEGVLATDMANHQSVLSNIKAKIASFNINKGNNFESIFKSKEIQSNLSKLFEAQQGVLNMLIHSADISNPAKPDKISEAWTKRVYDEFFVQGDMEKEMGLPISNFCDRNTTNINKAMIGFINYVVLPTFDLLSTLIWEAAEYRDHCKANLKKYQNNVKKEEREAKMNKKKK